MKCQHCNKIIKKDPAYWKGNEVHQECFYKLKNGYETIEESEKNNK